MEKRGVSSPPPPRPGNPAHPPARRAQGAPAPGRADWRPALLPGALLLLGGNGLVCWGQQFLPTGTAALLIATTPIWMGLIAWVLYRGPRPGLRLAAGMFLGF